MVCNWAGPKSREGRGNGGGGRVGCGMYEWGCMHEDSKDCDIINLLESVLILIANFLDA